MLRSLTYRQLILIAAGGSAALLIGALIFQYVGGLPPCKLCIWQRWPHLAAVVIGVLALWKPGPLLSVVGAVAALTTGLIGVYHVGVENKWWLGPQSCTSGGTSGMSSEELLQHILDAPVVRCDEVPWEMLGLSMAGWNAVISFALAIVWLMAWRRG